MIRMRYRFQYIQDSPATVSHTASIVATGETPEEVMADARRQMVTFGHGGFNLQSIGLDNYRKDWEAMHGPSPHRDSAFLDGQERLERLRAPQRHFWPRLRLWFRNLLQLEDRDLERPVPLFCACCGRELGRQVPMASGDWCMACVAHIDPEYTLPTSERTWEAQYGTRCPFRSVGVVRSVT
jgi:hypothetical protein